MKKKYLASVCKGAHQSKYRPENKTVRRKAGKAYGQQIKGFFNQRDLACGRRSMAIGGNPQSGFTLIELLVVIGIIAILAAVVIVAINPARQFALARDTQRTANVAAILNGIDENMAEHQGILTCDGVASTLGTNPNFTQIKSDDTNGGNLAPCLVPTYVSSLPFDPKIGSYTGPTDYNTGYTVQKDANGHITVSATSELLPDDGTISVTR